MKLGRFTTICSMALLAILALSFSLNAQSRGDVTVHFNAGPDLDKVFAGEVNILELWIRNQGPLYGMSIGLKLTSTIPGFFWDMPYGNVPTAPNQPFIQEYGDAVGKFDLGRLGAVISLNSDSILITGAADQLPLPAHSANTKLYDLKLYMPRPPTQPYDVPCGVTIDNIFFPPSGSWLFDEGGAIGAYAPTFNGQPNNSPEDPSALPICFELEARPCKGADFTVVPPANVFQGHCSEYSFDFDARGDLPPLVFSSTVGAMNQSTGYFTLNPSEAIDSVTTVIACVNDAARCAPACYGFKIHWINTAPNFTNCPIMPGTLGVHQVYEYPFASTDVDKCDVTLYSLTPVGTPPTGSYQVSADGFVTYTPTLADSGNSYQFHVTATDNGGASSNCNFYIDVFRPGAGDADGSGGTPDISDCVYLIQYIFGGGMPPHPLAAGDADGSGGTPDISDAVYLIQCIFGEGPCPTF